jgi:PAS domain S-box-containing protein
MERKDRRFINIIVVTFLTILVPIFLGNLLNTAISQKFINIPLHSALEVAGGVMAIVISIIFYIKYYKSTTITHLNWATTALLSMGIIDIFHGIVMPGELFVWLHSSAVFFGGVLFATVWLKEYKVSIQTYKTIPIVIVLFSILFSFLSIIFPQLLPTMVNEDKTFSEFANILNIIGGLGFFIAAGKFILFYINKHSVEDLLFAGHTMLFGVAGLLFVSSVVWDAQWWLWHILRFSAYTIALYFLYKEFFHEIRLREEQNILLQEQKDEFESIFQSSKDGIAIIDLKTNFLDFNEAYLKMSGFTKEELLKKSCLSLTSEEYKEKTAQMLERAIKDGYVENFEKVCVVNYEKKIIVNMSVSLMPDKERLLLISKDVTALKTIEDQSHLAAMGEMIGNIAHQWRQPLSVISTNATGLSLQQQHGMLTEEKVEKACNLINDNAQYLSRTIDDFRNFIKGDKDFFKLDIVDMIKGSLSLSDSSLKSNYIEVVTSLDDTLEILGSKNELEQVLINIINNAKDVLVEKLPEDERYIFISTKKVGEALELKILDNGGGIPSEILGKVFEPYFTTKHQSIGTGLGLSMVQKIIHQRHEQNITVNNEKFVYKDKEYIGACFMIVFKSNKNE